MFIKYNNLSQEDAHEFDICIIGAGAIGLSMALYLEDTTDLTVAVLDSGSLKSEESRADEVHNTGDISSGLAGSRAYGFGGSTTIWGGQALQFNDLDFSDRLWIENSKWPINPIDISPYYCAAEKIIGVDSVDFDTNICTSDITPTDLNTYREHDIGLSYSKFSPTPNFHDKYRSRIENSKRIFCYLDARIEFNQHETTKQITNVRIKSNCCDTFELIASDFVIACGGIDSPTILLSSNINGLNKLPIGRYYNDHIGIYGARLIPQDISKFRALFATRIKNGVKCVPKLALSEESQTTHQLGNINANIEAEASPNDPLSLMREVYSELRSLHLNARTARKIFELFKHPKDLIMAGYELLIKRRIFLPADGTFFLIANIESIPMYDSFIKAPKENPQAKSAPIHINWLTSNQTKTTAAHFYTAIKDSLEKNGVAKVILKQSIYETNDDWLDSCYGLYHHMSATKMSDSPKNGVVDKNCKVHTIPNLFIAGTSVLPTGSASNPTFTALALALRLCDHLKNKKS